MEFWRICRKAFADLSGEGARLVGGRWNFAGRPMVYGARTPELAALEVRVHLDLPPELLPQDYVLMRVECDGAIELVDPAPEKPAAFGERWLAEKRTPILRAPSFIIPEAHNFLGNPLHPGFSARVVGMREFSFDPRLWRT